MLSYEVCFCETDVTNSELNEILLYLFNEILNLEEKILINDEYKDFAVIRILHCGFEPNMLHYK